MRSPLPKSASSMKRHSSIKIMQLRCEDQPRKHRSCNRGLTFTSLNQLKSLLYMAVQSLLTLTLHLLLCYPFLPHLSKPQLHHLAQHKAMPPSLTFPSLNYVIQGCAISPPPPPHSTSRSYRYAASCLARNHFLRRMPAVFCAEVPRVVSN